MSIMAATKPDLKIFSEDEFGKKVDRCLTDTLVKGGNPKQYFVKKKKINLIA